VLYKSTFYITLHYHKDNYMLKQSLVSLILSIDKLLTDGKLCSVTYCCHTQQITDWVASSQPAGD